MKALYKAIIGLAVIVVGFGANSCTDPLRFGNDFLENTCYV